MNNKIVTLFSPGPFGGAEKLVIEAAKRSTSLLWLIKESRNPTPCTSFEQMCLDEGVEFKTYTSFSQLDFKLIGKLRSDIVSENIELIHSHGLKANFINSFLQSKKVATQHGRTSHTFKMRVLEFIENLALTRMDALICVSKVMFEVENSKRKHLVENFITKVTQKENYDIDKNIKMLYVGRLSPEKNLPPLIEAITQTQGVDLSIVGTGSEEPILKEMAGSIENIRFLGFQKDIPSLMLEHDVLALPSLREGLPIVLIEAITCGLPIFASNVGGIPDLVKENGVLFDPKNQMDLKNKLHELKDKIQDYSDNAQEFRKKACKRFSYERWEEETHQIYKSLL